ncbi:hypothetical protein OA253_01425 [Alphaproteobacteria bacterium]|nr:hypothetical protein [Alphaproteobacteria bacterium]
MKLFFILFFILFSNSVLSQLEKNSEDNFINLTNDIKDVQKPSKNLLKNNTIDKSSDNEIKKIRPVKIGKLEITSLGSIGVETNLNKKIGLDLWGNFTANDAIKYLNMLPNKSSSRSYQRFLNEVYASTSEPPKGNPNEISQFLKTKLQKLAFNGQVDYLTKIIPQLPESEKWERWKKWFIIHQFLVKDDINACQKINNTIKNYDNIFWKKANLLCLILQRNLSKANFIFDVMRSQNLLDNTFEILIDQILNEKQIEKFNFKNEAVTPLNLILLDIIKFPINFSMIKDFGFEYKLQLSNLIYLKPEARALLIDQITTFKDINRDLLIKIYQDVKFENSNQDEILKSLDLKPNGLNRAKVWLNATKLRDSTEKANFILKGLLIENKHNNSQIASDLYLPTLISLKTNSLSQSQTQIINHLYNLKNPEKLVNEPFSQILLNPKNTVWNERFISQHNAWNFVNFLSYLEMQSPNITWEDNINIPSNNLKKINDKFSLNVSHNEFILSRAIANNIKEKNYLKAILLIGKLISNKELKFLNLTTFQEIDMYLTDLGFLTLRNEFRNEVLFKKFFYSKNIYNEF